MLLSILIVSSVIVVAGSVIALAWWRLSRGLSPYEDELDRERAKAERRDANVVVVKSDPGAAQD